MLALNSLRYLYAGYMSNRNKKMDWKEELTRLYGWECLSREEVLSHMKRDFMDYPWSLITLCRRLRYFGIQKNDRRITIQKVMDVVSE